MALNFSRDNGPTLIKDSDFRKDLPIEMEDIPIEIPKEEFDYQKKLQEMLDNAQQQGGDSSVDLKISEVDFGAGFEGIVQLNRVEELMAQAKAFINEKQYAEAIDSLDQILTLDENIHEAIYLKGFCLASLSEFYHALEIIFPLRQVNVSNQLRSRIETLRTSIRNGMFLNVLLLSVADEQGGQNGRMIQYLEHLIGLDPEMGLYYFILSGGLMRRGRGEEALSVVKDGLRMDSTGMTDLLSGFRDQIQQAVMGQRLMPAVAAFKKGHYRQARHALKPVLAQFKNNDLVLVFDEYLKILDPGLLGFISKKQDELPAPQGDEDTVMSLYQLIVREEIDQAMQWLEAGRPDASIAMLLTGRAFAPRYPLINFMLGGLIYRFSEHLLTSGQKNIDETIALVRQARIYAQLGAIDKSNEEAPRLLAAIGQLIEVLDALRQMIHRRNEEIQIGNRLIGEFQEIMKAAQAGIQSVQQLNSLVSRLETLNDDLQDELPGITHEDIKKSLDQLDEAVKRSLGEVDAIRAQIAQSQDIERVNTLAEEYKAIMDSGQGGINSSAQLESIISRFESLSQKIGDARRMVTNPDGRQVLDQIAEATQKNLNQLSDLRVSTGESEKVANHYKTFKTMMDALNSGTFKITTRQELDNLISAFEFMKDSVEKDRRSVSSNESREALDNLVPAIENVLRQLRGY